MRASRSMLYIPGDSPKMIQNSPYFGADSILLDLEDAIAMAEKDSARRVVSTFLRNFDFGDLTSKSISAGDVIVFCGIRIFDAFR